MSEWNAFTIEFHGVKHTFKRPEEFERWIYLLRVLKKLSLQTEPEVRNVTKQI